MAEFRTVSFKNRTVFALNRTVFVKQRTVFATIRKDLGASWKRATNWFEKDLDMSIEAAVVDDSDTAVRGDHQRKVAKAAKKETRASVRHL